MSKRSIGFLLMGLAGILFTEGGWILAKAQLAQVLLEQSWRARLNGTAKPKPWPWADTWPVALLEAPRLGRLGKPQIVLAGSSGRNMAFGPTQVMASSKPGLGSNTVYSGHRDTHFSFLRHLKPGDPLRVQTPDGNEHSYRVEDIWVVDEHETWVAEPTEAETLTLITCYPFDSLVPGGPLRYVVRAFRTGRSGSSAAGLRH